MLEWSIVRACTQSSKRGQAFNQLTLTASSPSSQLRVHTGRAH